MDAAQTYQMLGRLVEAMPAIPDAGPIPREVAQWIARVGAIVEAVGDLTDKVRWNSAVSKLSQSLGMRISAVQEIPMIAYAVLAKAELAAPIGVQGTFIPAGGQFDAFAALSKIALAAKSDVMIIDPYLDGAALTDFGTMVPEGVPLRLLADKKGYGASLAPAAQRWKAQYGDKRPVEVRLAPERALHDRALFVDRKDAWALTQSLKDFAKRAHGEIVSTRDTAELKIAAYEDVWSRSESIG